MRILITGGFGYLGCHLSNHLLNKGHEVRILSRNPHPELSRWSNQFEVIIADVARYPSIENCCRNMDIVIHTAALNEADCRAKPAEALLVNGLGARNLLEDAHQNGVGRLIYLSTFHVYGIPKTEVITEKTLPEPVNSYSITHYLAERYCRQYEAESKLKSHILRISNGFGAPLFRTANCWTLVVNDLCATAFNQKKIVLKSRGTQERDFIGIRDIIQGVEIFIERDIADQGDSIHNLGSGQNISIISLANTVAEVYRERYNQEIKIEVPGDAAEPDFKTSFRFSIDRIKKLGYQPASVMKEEIHSVFKLLEG